MSRRQLAHLNDPVEYHQLYFSFVGLDPGCQMDQRLVRRISGGIRQKLEPGADRCGRDIHAKTQKENARLRYYYSSFKNSCGHCERASREEEDDGMGPVWALRTLEGCWRNA